MEYDLIDYIFIKEQKNNNTSKRFLHCVLSVHFHYFLHTFVEENIPYIPKQQFVYIFSIFQMIVLLVLAFFKLCF